MICEKCGLEMRMGYGLAGGGGIGPYFYCDNEDCGDPKLVKFKDLEAAKRQFAKLLGITEN